MLCSLFLITGIKSKSIAISRRRQMTIARSDKFAANIRRERRRIRRWQLQQSDCLTNVAGRVNIDRRVGQH